jgi:hypothetical protein
LSTKIDLKQGPEATNILWENRGISRKDFGWRCILVFLVILVTLLFSFFFILFLKQKNVKLSNNWGNVDCKKILTNQTKNYKSSNSKGLDIK